MLGIKGLITQFNDIKYDTYNDPHNHQVRQDHKIQKDRQIHQIDQYRQIHQNHQFSQNHQFPNNHQFHLMTHCEVMDGSHSQSRTKLRVVK